MERISLFSRYLLFSLVVTLFFVLSLGFLSFWIMRQTQRQHFLAPPGIEYARLLTHVAPKERPSALKDLSTQTDGPFFNLLLFDGTGKVLYSADGKNLLPEVLTESLPEQILKYTVIKESSEPPEHPSMVVKVDDNPAEYLFIGPNEKRSRHRSGPGMFMANFIAFSLAVIIGTTLSLFLIFYSLRQKAKLADSVISELQRGNLKARFPISKLDEVGKAMLRFNRMAAEIERLVERLKTTEKSRMTILQELAHDLRTPVASLKAMLETMASRQETLTPELKAEFMSTSLKEVDYFEHLVEDLLFLAQATDPSYNNSDVGTDLIKLINGEMETCEKSNSTTNKNISVQSEINIQNSTVRGDPHLLKRLFRNGLENAVSFAHTKVTLSIKNIDDHKIECIIEDDGPGFSAQALKEFGHRKMSRNFSPKMQKRASIGLGSVIMGTIAQLHRGDMKASNKLDKNGVVLGACITIVLPLS